jgi:type IV pilus assembly protein PilW
MINYGNKYGFTLVELLISIVISTIVLTAIYNLFISQNKIYTKNQELIEMEQNLRAALTIMTREIRMAGYNPHGTASVGINISNSSDSITCTFVDDKNEIDTITYKLYDSGSDGDNDLGRIKNSGYPEAIAYNISQITFNEKEKCLVEIYVKANSTQKNIPDLSMNETVACRNLCILN